MVKQRRSGLLAAGPFGIAGRDMMQLSDARHKFKGDTARIAALQKVIAKIHDYTNENVL